ncbi:hypothetical protein FisN_3Lh520 [Fistulifera solaris]|uniref:Alpha/beta hydrolase fold-3 domain-containing protein n=1 Tax=Fistulifera solaris TaxID=1519565 RepID=A0A1Z5J8K0_FISSO|nr:hypothetical protein FisN_3Lh520 [Fistulifera solaris]|eukprot:GAX10317.1 hypothetical protein FisN_3Lh520 [Fistulifera solaris]
MRKYPSEDSITVTRHYYSRQHRTFETSLDVYVPSSSTTRISSIVVLVVGSAWMGHTPWIYRGTSWWNRAGPRAVAQTSLCICVRHRGAFFQIPSPSILCVILLVSWLGTTSFWITLFLFLTWMWLKMVGQDAASLAEMQSDVEQAIQWIQQNKSNLCGQYTGGKDVPMYFGGYSSGAHVALTVLQRSAELTSVFQGIVLLSGVLAVRPAEVLPEKDHPRWLTDSILQIVFGLKDAKSIPSPLAGTIPPLPHLIIGCEEELWGWNWLNVFFCSRSYAEKARHCGIPVSYHEIVSDHWFILSHPELPKLLQRELPRLVPSSSEQEQS